MTHRKPRTAMGAQQVVRLGMVASVSIAALATASSADATATGSHIPRDVAAVVDEAHTLANRAHPAQYDDEFAIHELGPLIAAGARNKAVATSVGCSIDAPCRSIALSFQIVTTAGVHVHLKPTNTSSAVNRHCEGCQTFAGAYQFVVSTPQPFTLSSRARGELDLIHRRLDDLERSDDSVATIKSLADGLASEVVAILQRAAAAAPGGQGVDPLQSFRPTVTMRRHVS